MSFESEIITAAQRELEQRTARRAREFEDRRSEIYRRIPRTAELDRELRRTVAVTAAAALRKGSSPMEIVRAQRDRNLALQVERAKLLRDNGYPEDALTEKPFCALCGDRGRRNGGMCECLRELCSREQTRRLSSLLDLQGQTFDSFRLDFYPEELAPGTQPPSPRTRMRFTLDCCRKYAATFPKTPADNLFFTGAPGLGKTFLSAAIAGEVSGRGFSVVYESAGTVFSRFEARRFEKDAEAGEDVERYLGCDLLILDDLGSELTNAFTQSVLYDIVNTRLIEHQHTIISSNLSLAELRKHYTPAIVSRISGEYMTVSFFGKDIRGLKKSLQG